MGSRNSGSRLEGLETTLEEEDQEENRVSQERVVHKAGLDYTEYSLVLLCHEFSKPIDQWAGHGSSK